MDTTLDLFMKAGDSAFVIDDAQTIVLWNRSAEKTTGYAAFEAIGKPCWEIFQGHDTKGRVFCRYDCPVIEQVREGNFPPAFDMLATHRHGHLLPTNMSTIYRPGNGLPPRLIHLFRPTPASKAEHTGQFRVQLFGSMSAIRPDGIPVEGALWQRIKVRALLAFLALQDSRSVDRHILLTTLWPNLPREQALHNLNTTIYNLRRSLEPNLVRGNQSRYIHYRNGRYYLGKKHIWIDVVDFKQYIKNGQAEAEPQQALLHYQQAELLYQNGYLDEFTSVHDWFTQEQKRVYDLYVDVLEMMANLQLQLGQTELARDLYSKTLTFDQSRHRSREQLLYLLATHDATTQLRVQDMLDTQADLRMSLSHL